MANLKPWYKVVTPREDLRGLIQDLVGDRVVRLADAPVTRGRRREESEQAQVRRLRRVEQVAQSGQLCF